MNQQYSHFIRRLLLVTLALAGVILSAFVVGAQYNTPIVVSGTLNSINANGTIVVNGATYQLANGVSLPEATLLGVSVTLTGQLDTASGALIVASVTLTTPTSTPDPLLTPSATPAVTPTATIIPPEATPEVTPEVTADPFDDGNIIIVIEGPVQAINGNIIVIYNIDVQVREDHPILRLIVVGDFLRVEGVFSSGVLVVIDIGNVLGDDDSGGSILIEGPIEAINGNLIVINGVEIELSQNDPLLTTLVIGRYLRIGGDFEDRDGRIIIIVININVLTDDDVQIIICQGGMGMGMGMGMGNDCGDDDDD